MNDDLVEKVAKAIRDGADLCDYWGEVDITDSARAAITVMLLEMQEPSDTMNDAANEFRGQMSYADVWRTMLSQFARENNISDEVKE